MTTHPDTTIRYYALGMVINTHSDVFYLTASKAHSRAGGHYFLGSVSHPHEPIKLNIPIYSLTTILRVIAASAAEAKLRALFINAQRVQIIRLALLKLGHTQPPMPMHIDNSMAVGIVNNIIKCQKFRTMEMQYFWLLDQEAQKMTFNTALDKKTW